MEAVLQFMVRRVPQASAKLSQNFFWRSDQTPVLRSDIERITRGIVHRGRGTLPEGRCMHRPAHSFYPSELSVRREAEALRPCATDGYIVHVICLREGTRC